MDRVVAEGPSGGIDSGLALPDAKHPSMHFWGPDFTSCYGGLCKRDKHDQGALHRAYLTHLPVTALGRPGQDLQSRRRAILYGAERHTEHEVTTPTNVLYRPA